MWNLNGFERILYGILNDVVIWIYLFYSCHIENIVLREVNWSDIDFLLHYSIVKRRNNNFPNNALILISI